MVTIHVSVNVRNNKFRNKKEMNLLQKLALGTVFLVIITDSYKVQSCPFVSSLYAGDSAAFIESDNYPDNYYGNSDCAWVISAISTNYVVELTVLDSDLEDQSSCSFDYVAAYDGSSTSSQLLKKWCGTERPTIYSTGQRMYVRFITDDSTNSRGFKIQYRRLLTSSVSKTCPNSNSGGITLYASDTKQVIQSLNYPNSYSPNLDCTWVLQASSFSAVIEVTVIDSLLESPCSYDFVTAYDGSSIYSPVIQTWCGDQQPIVYSTGRSMTLRFRTDGTTNKKGFILQYRQTSDADVIFPTSTAAVTENCPSSSFSPGSSLDARYYPSFIQSVNYPLAYSPYQDCQWTLQAIDYDLVVELVVVDSLLESSSSCTYDYVVAYDGSSMCSSLIRRWCGYEEPTVYSTGRSMTIRFHSDGSSNYKGFRMQYRQVTRSQVPTTSNVSNVSGAIVGGCIAGVLILVGIGVTIYLVIRNQRATRPRNARLQTGNANLGGVVYSANNGPSVIPPSAPHPGLSGAPLYPTGNAPPPPQYAMYPPGPYPTNQPPPYSAATFAWSPESVAAMNASQPSAFLPIQQPGQSGVRSDWSPNPYPPQPQLGTVNPAFVPDRADVHKNE